MSTESEFAQQNRLDRRVRLMEVACSWSRAAMECVERDTMRGLDNANKLTPKLDPFDFESVFNTFERLFNASPAERTPVESAPNATSEVLQSHASTESPAL